MKFENTETFGWENAVLGIRLPMCKDLDEAIVKSDSAMALGGFRIGENDMKIIKNLINADDQPGKTGQPNSKFLRMIHVQVCITAPLSFFKEMDTYKVAVTSNSTSTMHTIQKYEITEENFEKKPNGKISDLIHVDEIEAKRKAFNENKENKDLWYDIIYGIGDSWLQTRMYDFNYATLRNIAAWRSNHKQNCWSGRDNPDMTNFMSWIKTLPYAEELIING